MATRAPFSALTACVGASTCTPARWPGLQLQVLLFEIAVLPTVMCAISSRFGSAGETAARASSGSLVMQQAPVVKVKTHNGLPATAAGAATIAPLAHQRVCKRVC